jgi:hypothetical protein
MSIATLNDIITKFRKLTGAANSQQIPDSEIVDYINSFYLYDFPANLRTLQLKTQYTFNTIQGLDTYRFDSEHFSTVEMPAYVAKREVKIFYDPWSFYGSHFNWQQEDSFATGDGTTGPYSGTLTSTPILRSITNKPIVQTQTATTNPYGNPQPIFQDISIGRVQNILITANTATGTLHVTDDGNGNLIGDAAAGGTINYQTGVIFNLTFTAAVPSGNEIFCQYNPVKLAIPLAILFYMNQFWLRPVPDKGYTVELQAYRLPSQTLLGSNDPNTPVTTGVPELREWWETLAFGAAKKFYEDRMDPDGITLMEKSLSERYSMNEVRVWAQLGKQRINTLYADQLQQSYGSQGLGINQTP